MVTTQTPENKKKIISFINIKRYCPTCKKELRCFGGLLGSDYWCLNVKCMFYKVKRWYNSNE